MTDSDSFSGEQAAAANTALRAALGLGPQQFSKQQLVGMISEEIEQLRASGKTDDDIVEILANKAGTRVDAESIARYYADDAERTGYP